MAELHRMQNLRVDPRLAGQLAGIDLVTFTVTSDYRPHLTHMGHDDLVTQFGEPLAGPERVGAGFSREADGGKCAEAGLKGRTCAPHASLFAESTIRIEQTELTPLIAEINADR
jgi:hypothetical protein